MLYAPPVGSGVEPQLRSNLVHFSLIKMPTAGNQFEDFPEKHSEESLRKVPAHSKILPAQIGRADGLEHCGESLLYVRLFVNMTDKYMK